MHTRSEGENPQQVNKTIQTYQLGTWEPIQPNFTLEHTACSNISVHIY